MRLLSTITAMLALALSAAAPAAEITPEDIIRQAMDHWRGLTSHGQMTMVIHRPDWERSMSMEAWTEGDKRSLVRVTAPVRDAGNGTLVLDNDMWTYSPKINRVIKVPSSMMNQSWMGSDLSNKDISKSTDIIDQYDHTLLDSRKVDGHQAWVIQSIPHEEAAVVWGREVWTIRDDFVLLEQQFWDQDGVLVKTFTTLEIAVMGGRTVATKMRMQEVDKPDEWTELRVDSTRFNVDLPANLFTLSNLRNPRQ
ncbi:outer membrane lipoprotein-sorting protein [Seongchinamella sediminis]|uniref:Outer membrane lipoprotein-sorting protein n=1 Tax=Seongchinamella sediminis TaxID=2283635 RepID=A0A3L7DWN4_9GAMM|nr:outer membrane lipoprotein-sorting protein [Seongchinamella sediminis]RLQ21010.1 outer membrane lipoprotein-sorting protein [Seongchinamella sediminis]